MNKELIINSTSKGLSFALLEDKQLVELHQEKPNNPYQVGDIYLGRVRKVAPGLNAAFVDTGYGKDAFLHYTDLSPDIRSLLKLTKRCISGNFNDPFLKNMELETPILKTGKINEVLKGKQTILVQILKEPISTKGPRLTCEISIAGRFLVLIPFSNSVGVSKRISTSEERKRLKEIIQKLKPINFGVVIRTAAEGKNIATLHDDLMSLLEKWKSVAEELKGAHPPKKVLSELDKTSSFLRDFLNDSFNKVTTNNSALTREFGDFIAQISPDKKNIVTTYNGNASIFDNFGITHQIKSSFGKSVTMNGGGYLVIEHTEALHVIDVNSGNKMSKDDDQETNALNVNLQAAEEISRQLRLRDIGGIIIVDFIDMRKPDNKKKVLMKMKEIMNKDRAKHAILPLSKFNLMQITRERVRPEVNISTTEACPTCRGSGKIEASILLVEEIEKNVSHIFKTHSKGLKLTAHPFIDAFIKKGFPSSRLKWAWKYRKWIKLTPNNDYGLTEYRFFDENDVEIII